jgi:hypothetical protein
MKKKYLKTYHKFCELGKATFLCDYYRNDKLFDLFKPTKEELIPHAKEGYSVDLDRVDAGIWGCYERKNMYEFTELRQNIILFMAAMNGEL